MWATIGRRTFLAGTSAALLAQAGHSEPGETLSYPPIAAKADPYGFGLFVRERWPGTHLAKPHPDHGIDYLAFLPVSKAVEGTTVSVQLQEAELTAGKAVTTVKDLLRWEEFARANGRALLVSACSQDGRSRFYVIDSREARRRAALHGGATVQVPEAYELDDLTFALLWSCASLDNGLQADDQELTTAAAELAPYEELPSSAVSREAAASLGATAHQWLGSDFCARHILRNMTRLSEIPVFWTREQTGSEACPWLLFDHKYAYLRATGERFIWHVDTARRASVLSGFREAAGHAGAHSVIDAPTARGRLQALAGYLGIDWPWLQRRCGQLAETGTAGLLRPRSRHISTAGVDVACAFVAQAGEDR